MNGSGLDKRDDRSYYEPLTAVPVADVVEAPELFVVKRHYQACS